MIEIAMAINFRIFSGLFLLLILTGTGQDVFAKKRLRIFRVKIIHFDNSRTKGVLYEVSKDGIVLVRARHLLQIPRDEILKNISQELVPVMLIPFDRIKRVGLWRRKAVGRDFAIGAVGSMLVAGAITMIDTNNHNNNSEHCGCGPPALLIIPPAAAILGGAVGAIVGLVPKKVVGLDPDRPFESAQEQLGNYSVSTQLQ